MLSIFTLAYQGVFFADLPSENTQEATLRLAFASYVERMLTRRGHLTQWKSEQVKHFLTFLAGQMHQRNMSIFSVKELQPDWLPAKQRLLYQLIGVLTGALFFGLVVGLVVGLAVGLGAFIQHFILRFWLWRLGYLPWNLVSFLDEASKRLLLRKVGGALSSCIGNSSITSPC